ncbi:HSP20-like chaperone [Piedraia hortae CBS 480.64]|uniref:HSP20-like chaperone n=1 Tax=Piedraia hortae CBS 480.64 TaxID=1314780 RepID=A0A6A7C304_9PEZI|nr:HSP20-like chaperone [Piedraia hortae CBS 480.64]
MAFYQNDFVPMFRFLDDYANHVASSSDRRVEPASHVKSLTSFKPKFDIQETKDAYKLHGEFPGIDQKDISIEFTDPQTINITGHYDRSYEEGERPQQQQQQQQIEHHKPTVEDEKADSKESEPSKEVTQQQQKVQKQQSGGKHTKFWLSERSSGHFSRTFSFPAHVDQNNVKASLKNGVLTVTVPKAEKVSKRIQIE